MHMDLPRNTELEVLEFRRETARAHGLDWDLCAVGISCICSYPPLVHVSSALPPWRGQNPMHPFTVRL